MMASYSKVFKAAEVSMSKEVKVIIREPISFGFPQEENQVVAPSMLEDELNAKAQLILEEAEQKAAEIVERAQRQAQAIELETTEKIKQWWNENEEKLESMSKEAFEQGYEDGIIQGKEQAESLVQKEYEAKIHQAEALLEQGFEEKGAIIAEAEPFLLEMSTVIAEQIVKQELTHSPEKFVDLIQQHILRFKEKDSITICVHPDDFDFIQTQRGHLVSVVNGETEIKIIPDHSVTAKGCIIRTAYGSVDARIDTQIEEIKKAILDARREPEIVAVN